MIDKDTEERIEKMTDWQAILQGRIVKECLQLSNELKLDAGYILESTASILAVGLYLDKRIICDNADEVEVLNNILNLNSRLWDTTMFLRNMLGGENNEEASGDTGEIKGE